ncbi:unnamed protein product [Cuscuta epithymum]|uniref:Uncharacterized protein n=1 Tax=Cuscuta epithymum TaxID=186058 RepID=A0AAV0ECP3_9ASTE|nr:unnamed protein product [Cuscuta epithymum]
MAEGWVLVHSTSSFFPVFLPGIPSPILISFIIHQRRDAWIPASLTVPASLAGDGRLGEVLNRDTLFSSSGFISFFHLFHYLSRVIHDSRLLVFHEFSRLDLPGF